MQVNEFIDRMQNGKYGDIIPYYTGYTLSISPERRPKVFGEAAKFEKAGRVALFQRADKNRPGYYIYEAHILSPEARKAFDKFNLSSPGKPWDFKEKGVTNEPKR